MRWSHLAWMQCQSRHDQGQRHGLRDITELKNPRRRWDDAAGPAVAGTSYLPRRLAAGAYLGQSHVGLHNG